MQNAESRNGRRRDSPAFYSAFIILNSAFASPLTPALSPEYKGEGVRALGTRKLTDEPLPQTHDRRRHALCPRRRPRRPEQLRPRGGGAGRGQGEEGKEGRRPR